MLKLDSIGKRLGSFTMSGLSLRIEPGEYFVLLGPSGVGKTVLIEIIAGLICPDEGRIFWDGTDITRQAPEKRRFAVVYQDYALFGHLTVAQNIAYGLRAAKVSSAEIKRRVGELAETLHISEFLDSRPGILSGGQQQRTALARALAVQPKLLLLDEPLSALDTNIRLKLRKELKRVNRQLNVPVLHVTHDPEEAMAVADRVGVMLDSRIQQTAPPEELFRRPTDPAVADFLGMANVLTVSKANGGICLASGVRIHAEYADESTNHAWIKPEEIILSPEPFGSSAQNQLPCRVIEWQQRDCLLAVRLASGKMPLTALITHKSFEELGLKAGMELYATFKSSAIHCF